MQTENTLNTNNVKYICIDLITLMLLMQMIHRVQQEGSFEVLDAMVKLQRVENESCKKRKICEGTSLVTFFLKALY